MIRIWALADVHLAFGDPSKSMEAFGPLWERYAERIESNWKECIGQEDLVLIAGDISWAMKPEDARVDLLWLDALPGKKVILRGNHDYWWPSSKAKLHRLLPPSIVAIHNDAFLWNGVAVGGSRLWDSSEYRFDTIVHFQENPRARSHERDEEESEKIFVRELGRLQLSLEQMHPEAHTRIAMTHYPPIGLDLVASRASALLEKFNIDLCIFGHLHNIKQGPPLFGKARGVNYILTSADYLEFRPMQINVRCN